LQLGFLSSSEVRLTWDSFAGKHYTMQSRTNLASGLKIEGACFLETMLSDGSVTAMRDYVSVPLDQRRRWLERPGAPK